MLQRASACEEACLVACVLASVSCVCSSVGALQIQWLIVSMRDGCFEVLLGWHDGLSRQALLACAGVCDLLKGVQRQPLSVDGTAHFLFVCVVSLEITSCFRFQQRSTNTASLGVAFLASGWQLAEELIASC